MQILVVGDGKVGHTIAENLARENHNVTVVDKNEDVLKRTDDTLDVMCVHGNGADAATLKEAGAERADIIIAATAGDETNMLCCLLAKRLGTKYAIARIRDPEYNASLALLKKEMGIDQSVNPERATALEISRLLRFPFASTIDTFAKGRVEMVAFRAQEDDPFIGIPMRQVAQKLHGQPRVLYAAVERDGEVIIPNGDFAIQPDDIVHVVADMITITEYFRFLGRNTLKVRNVMLLGGGRISFYLSKMISAMGFRVTLIEIREDKARALSESLPNVNIICGDGTDQELLNQEGLDQMDAFVALGDRDEENLMTALFAHRHGVPKVIVKNNRVAYADIIHDMGLDSIVSPKDSTCANVLRYVRGRLNVGGTKVERLYKLVDGRAEALEFIARATDSYIGIPLKNLHIKNGTLVAVIVREGNVIVPFGNDFIEAGDNVVIISAASGISDLNEVIRK